MEGERKMKENLAIQTKGLIKRFNETVAVNGLDLEVQRGSLYGFLGLNGSGKSTTIKMLLNLVFPTSGAGKVLGYDIVADSMAIRQIVGYVPEERVIYGYMSVGEAIDFCRTTSNNWDMKIVGRYLELFELSVGKKVKTMSRGMKNQLALVLALGSRPDLLILDEPTSGLDPAKMRDFYKVILEQVAETGQTVFFSSHNLQEVERLADTVGIIHKGKIVFNKTLDEIKTDLKKIRAVFKDGVPVETIKRMPSIVNVEVQGRELIIECEKRFEPVIGSLKQLDPVDLEILDVRLEDIFMRCTGGEHSGS